MAQPIPSPLRALPLAPAHGGRLVEARQLFPFAPEPFIDLSTGINPAPYPIPPLRDEVWTRLPDPEAIAALEVAAAHAYGVADASLVVAAPGTQSIISLIPGLMPKPPVAILVPTYGEYARAFALRGSRIVEAASLDRLGDARSVVLCNPNNPDGRRLEATAILEALRAQRVEGLVVVDESFSDLEDEALSLAPHLPQPGIVVLRSLSKTFGLAGLRLGFALAAPDLSAPLRAALGPWPVSGPAIEIGKQALADRAWLQAAKQRLSRDVQRLDALLDRAGLVIVGGTLLFRLATSGRAAALFQRLGEAGILVRRFEQRPDWLRFGIPGSDEAWRRLADELS
ncbi:MAG: threonine-phosphate decarboxylase CobD [Methyloceanibacter sp.]